MGNLRSLSLLVLAGVLAGVGTASAKTIAFWPFGTSGVRDVSGECVLRTDANVSVGETAVLNGQQQWFSTDSFLDLSSYSAVTVEFWVRFMAADNPGCVMLMELSEDINGSPGAFYFTYNEKPNMTIGMLRGGDTSCGADDVAQHPIADGQWHHLALVIDTTRLDETCTTLYVDKTNSYTQCTAYPSAAGGPGPTTLANKVLYIGSRANKSLQFKGEIDNVRISSGVLSPDRFINLDGTVDGGTPALAYYPFGSARTTDASGNGNGLIADGGVTFTDGCAVMDGSAKRFSTALPLDLRSCADGLTAEFWMNIPVDAPATTQIMLEFTGDAAADYSKMGAFYVDVNEGNTKVCSMCRLSTGGAHMDETTERSVNDGQWHHVAFVWDPGCTGDERFRLYLDGEQLAQTAGPNRTGDAFSGFKRGHLYIGNRANETYHFVGSIDDVRITPQALTPEEFSRARTEEDAAVLGFWTFARMAPLAAEKNSGSPLTAGGAVAFSNGVAVLDGSGSLTSAPLPLDAYAAFTAECWFESAEAVPVDALFRFGASATVPGTIPAASGWRHAALVCAEGGARLLLDGAETEIVDAAFDATPLFASAAAQFGCGLTGRLDDVRVTGAALPAAQLLKTRSDDSPITVAHWRFRSTPGLEDEMEGNPLAAIYGNNTTCYEDFAHFAWGLGLRTQLPLELSAYPAYTVECWVRPDSVGGIMLEQSGDYNWSTGSFCFSTDMLSHGFPGIGFRTQGSGYSILESARPLDDGAWHHCVMTVDRTRGALDVHYYVDGVEGVFDPRYRSTADTVFSSQPLFFGARGDVHGFPFDRACPYRGDIADVRISSGVLPPEEWLKFEDAVTAAETMADWTFDGTGEDALADASGNGHTLTGSADAGNGLATFDGTTFLRTVDPLDLSGCHQVTVEAVFRVDDIAPSSIIFEHGEDYAVRNGSISFYTVGGTSGQVDACTRGQAWRSPTNVVHDCRWHHVAVMLDMDVPDVAVNDRVRFYVDGNEARLFKAANRPDWVLDQKQLGNYVFYLGMRAGQTFPFTGQLKRVRVSKGLRSPDSWLKIPPPEVDGSDVMAFWPFTREATFLQDETGHGYDLVAADGVTFSKIEGCASMAAGHAALQTASQVPFASLTNFTVECFARSASTNLCAVLGTTPAEPAKYPGFNIATAYSSSFGGNRIAQTLVEGGYAALNAQSKQIYVSDYRAVFGGILDDGAWHHLAIVVDRGVGAYGQVRGYVDHVQTGAVDIQHPFTCTTAIFEIGSVPGCAVDKRLEGCIDDVRITAAALPPERFLAHRKGASGLVFVVR